jgi:hypothetical protein
MIGFHHGDYSGVKGRKWDASSVNERNAGNLGCWNTGWKVARLDLFLIGGSYISLPSLQTY